MKTYICTKCSNRTCVVATETSGEPNACPYRYDAENWHEAGKEIIAEGEMPDEKE